MTTQKPRSKKLSLRRQTVRALSHLELERVNGGIDTQATCQLPAVTVDTQATCLTR